MFNLHEVGGSGGTVHPARNHLIVFQVVVEQMLIIHDVQLLKQIIDATFPNDMEKQWYILSTFETWYRCKDR